MQNTYPGLKNKVARENLHHPVRSSTGDRDICVVAMPNSAWGRFAAAPRTNAVALSLENGDQTHPNAKLRVDPKNEELGWGKAEIPHIDQFFPDQLNCFVV